MKEKNLVKELTGFRFMVEQLYEKIETEEDIFLTKAENIVSETHKNEGSVDVKMSTLLNISLLETVLRDVKEVLNVESLGLFIAIKMEQDYMKEAAEGIYYMLMWLDLLHHDITIKTELTGTDILNDLLLDTLEEVLRSMTELVIECEKLISKEHYDLVNGKRAEFKEVLEAGREDKTGFYS